MTIRWGEDLRKLQHGWRKRARESPSEAKGFLLAASDLDCFLHEKGVPPLCDLCCDGLVYLLGSNRCYQCLPEAIREREALRQRGQLHTVEDRKPTERQIPQGRVLQFPGKSSGRKYPR